LAYNDRDLELQASKSFPTLPFLNIFLYNDTMEVIREAPSSDSYIPLSTHQSQTPESFYSGPPVLYHYSPSATLQIHPSDLAAAPALSGLGEGTPVNHVNGSPSVNGDDASDADRELSIRNIDIWVTSE
jgi:nucleotide-sensitive chloride channel 1A